MATLREFWLNRQNRRIMLVGFAILGIAVLAFGVFTFMSAWNTVHSHTERIEEFPHDLTKADDSTLLLVDAHHRALEKATLDRRQSAMIMGLGLLILGLAYWAAPEKEA